MTGRWAAFRDCSYVYDVSRDQQVSKYSQFADQAIMAGPPVWRHGQACSCAGVIGCIDLCTYGPRLSSHRLQRHRLQKLPAPKLPCRHLQGVSGRLGLGLGSVRRRSVGITIYEIRPSAGSQYHLLLISLHASPASHRPRGVPQIRCTSTAAKQFDGQLLPFQLVEQDYRSCQLSRHGEDR